MLSRGPIPALFQATGFAHHPYSFFLPPSATMSDPNFAPLSDLGRLEQALDAIFSTYGASRQLPLYLTEYGYETNPLTLSGGSARPGKRCTSTRPSTWPGATRGCG